MCDLSSKYESSTTLSAHIEAGTGGTAGGEIGDDYMKEFHGVVYRRGIIWY
jgi:hypothetical protein